MLARPPADGAQPPSPRVTHGRHEKSPSPPSVRGGREGGEKACTIVQHIPHHATPRHATPRVEELRVLLSTITCVEKLRREPLPAQSEGEERGESTSHCSGSVTQRTAVYRRVLTRPPAPGPSRHPRETRGEPLPAQRERGGGGEKACTIVQHIPHLVNHTASPHVENFVSFYRRSACVEKLRVLANDKLAVVPDAPQLGATAGGHRTTVSRPSQDLKQRPVAVLQHGWQTIRL